MTIAFRALFIAIFATIKRWKIVFFLFCFNLVFGLLVALPMISEIGGQAGRFGGLGGFIGAFDPETFFDFMHQGDGAASKAATQTGTWGLVYFFLFNVLTAGAIVILADTRERTRLKSFFRACGAFCYRFFRLLFYYAVFLALLALLNGLLNGAVCWLFEDFLGYGAGSETLGWILFSKNVLMLIALVFALLSFNYAKTAAVIEDGHFMGYYFLRGMGFCLAHPLATGLFFGLSLVPLFLVILLYFLLARGVDPQASYPFLRMILPWDWSISGAAYYILIAQISQFLLQACLVLRFAGQVYIFKRYMVFAAHPDPDLQKSIPESYFVVDKPEPEGPGGPGAGGRSYGGAIPLVFLCLTLAGAGLCSAAEDEPLSRRVVAYTITARLETETWILDGSETVSFRNTTQSATNELVFHLYANAIANSGTVNQKGRRTAADFAALDRMALGYMDVKSVTLADGSALPASPAIDGTIMRVPLARPLEPGGEIAVAIAFSVKLPHRSLSRSGFIGHHFQASQWYPKLAVLEEGGWIAPQFLRNAEFYGPFGTFDVTVTLPADFNVEGTGRLSDVTIDEKGELKTVNFHAEDVHDFAWVADANALMPTPSTYDGVKIVNVVQPYAEAKTDQINRVLKECLALYADWYMPYPYERLVVVGAPHRISSGMEYPGFINISFQFPLHLDWFTKNTFDPSGVTVHEFTHQYFYGIVANNEARDPWLDEGLTSYSTAKAMDAIYGPGVSITFLARLEKMMLLHVLNRGFGLYGLEREGTLSFWKRALNVTSVMGYGRSPFHGEEMPSLLGYTIEDLNIDGFNTHRSIWMKKEYAPLAETTVVTAPVGEFYPESYHPIAYSKAALALETIENHIGRKAMQDIIKTYVEKFRFAHPRGEDFLAILADKAGPQYSGMIDQLFQGTGTVDFAVDYVVCHEIEEPVGFVTQTAPGDAVVYRSPAEEDEKEEAAEDQATPPSDAADPAEGAGREAENAGEPQEGAPEPSDVVPPAGGESAPENAEEPAVPEDPAPSREPAPGYEWEAIIRNRGTVALPVEVELLFEGGRTERRVYNGWEPFMHLQGRSPDRLVCVTVDPDHKFSLDLNIINNSRTVRYQKESVLFLSGVAHFWTQNILNGWAFFN